MDSIPEKLIRYHKKILESVGITYTEGKSKYYLFLYFASVFWVIAVLFIASSILTGYAHCGLIP